MNNIGAFPKGKVIVPSPGEFAYVRFMLGCGRGMGTGARIARNANEYVWKLAVTRIVVEKWKAD